jgi:hypothetical protein
MNFSNAKLFFLKHYLTGTMGLLRHFPPEIVNIILEELINCELIQ